MGFKLVLYNTDRQRMMQNLTLVNIRHTYYLIDDVNNAQPGEQDVYSV